MAMDFSVKSQNFLLESKLPNYSYNYFYAQPRNIFVYGVVADTALYYQERLLYSLT